MIGRSAYPSPHPMDMNTGYPPYPSYSHRQDYPDYRQGMMYRPYPGMMGMHPHGGGGPLPSMEYSPYPGGMMGGHMGMMRPRVDGMSDMGYPVHSPGPSMADWHWQQQRSRMSSPHHLQQMMYMQQQQHHHHHPHLPSASSSPRLPVPQVASPQIEYHHSTSRPLSRGGAEAIRIQWQDQSTTGSKLASAMSAKPEMRGDLKQERGNESGEGRTAPHTASTETMVGKRTVPDWSGCVEGTKPQMVKRRRLNCDHCGE